LCFGGCGFNRPSPRTQCLWRNRKQEGIAPSHREYFPGFAVLPYLDENSALAEGQLL
jgi:hypothetical protein